MSVPSVPDQSATDLRLVEDVRKVEKLLGLVGIKRRKTLLKFAFRFLYFDGRLGREDLSALLAESGVAIVLPPASVTFDRGNRLGPLFGDVFPMQTGEFPLSVLAEHGNIPRGCITPCHPSLAILDMGLIQVAARQERGGRLAEVREGDRLSDTDPIGRLFEYFADHSVGDTFGFRYFAS